MRCVAPNAFDALTALDVATEMGAVYDAIRAAHIAFVGADIVTNDTDWDESYTDTAYIRNLQFYEWVTFASITESDALAEQTIMNYKLLPDSGGEISVTITEPETV